MLVCFFTDEKSDSSIPLYVLPLYSLLAPEKQAKVKDLLSQWVNDPYRYVWSLSKVTCTLWVKISILDYPSAGRLEWPNGQAGMGSEQALLGNVPVQQVGRDEKWQSCSMLKLVMAPRYVRIPLPTGSSYKFLHSLLGFGGGSSISKYDSTLVSAPPGAPVDVSEGLTELDRELQSWRERVKSLVSLWGFTCNAICLVIPL